LLKTPTSVGSSRGVNIFSLKGGLVFNEIMRLDADKTERLMEMLNWTTRVFADVINIEIREACKLVSGTPVNYYTAKAFIAYFKAKFAVEFIDFAAMGTERPKFLRRKPADEVKLFATIARNVKNKIKEGKKAV
jgi:hypothetical protein